MNMMPRMPEAAGRVMQGLTTVQGWGRNIWLTLRILAEVVLVLALVLFFTMPLGHVVFDYWSSIAKAWSAPAKAPAYRSRA